MNENKAHSRTHKSVWLVSKACNTGTLDRARSDEAPLGRKVGREILAQERACALGDRRTLVVFALWLLSRCVLMVLRVPAKQWKARRGNLEDMNGFPLTRHGQQRGILVPSE
jgi:hypothetical protein